MGDQRDSHIGRQYTNMGELPNWVQYGGKPPYWNVPNLLYWVQYRRSPILGHYTVLTLVVSNMGVNLPYWFPIWEFLVPSVQAACDNQQDGCCY